VREEGELRKTLSLVGESPYFAAMFDAIKAQLTATSGKLSQLRRFL
jgi:hypothetical protein